MRSILKLLPLFLCLALPQVSQAKRNNTGFTCSKAGLEPVGPSCVEVTCSLIGGCRSSDDLDGASLACRNNLDGRCLSNICQMRGVRTCSSLADIQAIAPSCQGVCDASCTTVACDKYGCNNTQKIFDVNLACSGLVSGDCLSLACQSADCATQEGLQQASRSCGSQM